MINKLAFYDAEYFASPAKLAALIQVSAASISGMIGLTAWKLGFNLPILITLLVCGALAAALATMTKMDVWWRYISFIFTPALWAALHLELSANYYLVGFLILVIVYWNTFQSQVPYYPASLSLWKLVGNIIPQNKPLNMLDIGSGLGDLMMNLAKLRPESQFLGVEIAPLPWAISVLRAKLKKSQARFQYQDYQALDLAHFDVVFAYLSPAAMPMIWEQAMQEMRTGTLLISHEFQVPDVKPYQTFASNQTAPTTYVYQINK